MLPTACCGSMSNLRLVNFVLFRRRQILFVKNKKGKHNGKVRSLRGYKSGNPRSINCVHKRAVIIYKRDYLCIDLNGFAHL